MSFYSSERDRKKKRQTDPADLTETARKIAGDRAEALYYGKGMRNTDPLYMLTTSFTENFNAIGMERARRMQQDGESDRNTAENGETDRSADLSDVRKKHDSPEYLHSTEELKNGGFADRFSAYAFRGGKLAAAVMAGQGKQMFTLCLSRALGRPLPNGERQNKLLGESCTEMHVPGREADVRFNRDVYSAVGVVTDAIKSSGRLLELFRGLAIDSGSKVKDPLEFRNISTLRQALPFFDTETDRRLIGQYSERLRALENDSSPQAESAARLLRSALVKQNAVLKKKQQEQRDFLTMLDRITANVGEAEKMFSSDGFAEIAAEEVEALSEDIPPEDGRNRSRIAWETAESVAEFLSGIRGEKDSGTDESEHAGGQKKPGEGKEER